MKVQDVLLPFYCIACVFPFSFVGYSLVHLFLHRKDGIQREHTSSRAQQAKQVLSGFLTLCSLLNSIDGFTQLQYHEDLRVLQVRTVFFSIQTIAWVFSLSLVMFDYNRRLHAAWYGQRLFILMNVFVYIALCTLEGIEMDRDHLNYPYEIAQLTLYAISSLLACVLTLFFLLRPNDFFKSSNLYYSFAKGSLSKSTSTVTEIDAANLLTIEINDFKTKLRADQTPTVYYNVTVRSNYTTHTVKHTYAEFSELSCTLKRTFPSVKLPDLPKFDTTRDSVGARMTELAKYLEGVCVPEVICGELLDFLGIGNPWRGQLVEFSRQLVARRASLTRINEELAPLEALSVLEVSIGQWEDSESFVRYQIKWVAPGLNVEGVLNHRYNELHNLHKTLKNRLAPGKLPSFPPKNIFALADDSIYKRARELQKYLNHIANDPAYLCKEFLDFMGCSLSVETLWRRMSYKTVRLVEMTWESECSEDNQLTITYIIKLERGDVGWTIHRRYSEFFHMNQCIVSRSSSPQLDKYLEKMHHDHTSLPPLPKKSIRRLTDSDDIERRRNGLGQYLEKCLMNPSIRVCYAFKEFLSEVP
jgi:hypothetical protein